MQLFAALSGQSMEDNDDDGYDAPSPTAPKPAAPKADKKEEKKKVSNFVLLIFIFLILTKLSSSYLKMNNPEKNQKKSGIPMTPRSKIIFK